MKYEDLITRWIVGDRRGVVMDIEKTFTWYDFADRVEGDIDLTPQQKVAMLTSMLRIRSNVFE